MGTPETATEGRVRKWAGIAWVTAFFACVVVFSPLPFETRMRADAERGPTGWKIYLKNVPGRSISYRQSAGGPFVPAEHDPSGYYDMLTIEAPPADDLGIMPIEIEYTTWVGVPRRTTFAFDMTAWQASRAWSNVYSSGGACWLLRDAQQGSGTRTLRIGMTSDACVRWRYGVAPDRVDTLLPVGAKTFTVPDGTGAVYVRQHICDGKRTWIERLDTNGMCEPDGEHQPSDDPLAAAK